LLSLCLFLICQAEVIDRIAAVVDGHIITLSDVRREREIRTLFGEKYSGDDRTLARELADKYLIEQQVAGDPNVVVADAEVQTDLERLGLFTVNAPASIRDAVRRRIRLQKFFDLKFRQFIRPTEEELRKYYEDVFLPEARARGLETIPSLADPEMANAIRENVIQEKLDQEVNVWLEVLRRRSNIEVLE
jgi:parvulin-like peptidyl-prolyl isomerase